MVALDYFRRLGRDNHRRLSKLHTWEEPVTAQPPFAVDNTSPVATETNIMSMS